MAFRSEEDRRQTVEALREMAVQYDLAAGHLDLFASLRGKAHMLRQRAEQCRRIAREIEADG